MLFPSNLELKSPIELLIMLTIRKEKEIHGFELIKKLDQFEYWKPQAGTIYPILERLTKRKFLKQIKTSEEETRKKVLYSLTNEGEKLLENSVEILEMIMNFFEKFFEIENEIIHDDSKFIDFIQNRIKKYLDLFQQKEFQSSPEVLLKIDQLYDFLNTEFIEMSKKISELKEEGKFVKIDIK